MDADEPAPPTSRTKIVAGASRKLGLLLVAIGALSIVGTGVVYLQQGRAAAPPAQPQAEEGAFLGDAGYVLKLPPGYMAARNWGDAKRTIEIVHFARAGTDPSSFLDEGLYGGLGIVRLEARSSDVGTTLDGIERLAAGLSARAEERREKYALTHLRLPTLRGFQVVYGVPFPRVEAYVVSDRLLFTFYAGQDDETYRTLLQSLRDTRAEL